MKKLMSLIFAIILVVVLLSPTNILGAPKKDAPKKVCKVHHLKKWHLKKIGKKVPVAPVQAPAPK